MRNTWKILASIIIITAVALPAPAFAANTTALIPSIFANTGLEDAGWSACPTPIQWSIDDSRLGPAKRAREERRFGRALAKWGRVTGLQFTFAGRTQLRYDAGSTQLTDISSMPLSGRHIDVAVLPQRVSPLMAGSGLGFGAPSVVTTGTKEIQTGKVVLRLDHVRNNSASAPRELKSLYLHELGHVLGLTHATAASDLMAPIVDTNTTISALDVQSVQHLMKPCAP